MEVAVDRELYEELWCGGTGGDSGALLEYCAILWVGLRLCIVAQAATDVLDVSKKARQTQVTSEIEGTLLAV